MIRVGLWGTIGKRWFDLCIAVIILALLWPLLIALVVAIWLKLGRPIIFSQVRLGYRGAEFKLYKFRSMSDERGSDGNLLPDHLRLTRFGRLLRSSSLDEIPQIVNIICGDMSFIGPRPTLVSYKSLLLEKYPERFDVLPGITSLPAVSGRNALDWDTKFGLDVEYVRRFGFWMDMFIFARTIPVVLGRKGVSMPGHVTATRYDSEVEKKGD